MINLQYVYAQINVSTGECLCCFTSSYQIPIPEEYIEIPVMTDDYTGKYYNASDGFWYYDAAFTDLWEECPSHNV